VRAGLDTCGTGETGEPTAKHESCCRSLPLPTRTERSLDKYEITAGRLRVFIESIAAQNNGVPDVRGFAKSYAAANPGSQLASVASGYPGLLDILPNQAGPTAPLPLPVHLGAFPLDPINDLDGCFTAPNKNGHATYWQPKSDLEPFGIGVNGVRKYAREVLDEKPVNCVMPVVLATFCAWDGGELARTADYHEVWGRHPEVLGSATVYVPWASILSVGQFGWRNGIGTATCPAFPWPGCVDPPYVFYASPAQGLALADDATPVFAAPGRYPLDVTAIQSANGEGWVDVGGNLMDAA
jgi:hypothetical protein